MMLQFVFDVLSKGSDVKGSNKLPIFKEVNHHQEGSRVKTTQIKFEHKCW